LLNSALADKIEKTLWTSSEAEPAAESAAPAQEAEKPAETAAATEEPKAAE